MMVYVEERTIEEANFIIQTKCTIRACAAHFKVSKATVHRDMTDRLITLKPELYRQVRRILDDNFANKHIRGGEVTKNRILQN